MDFKTLVNMLDNIADKVEVYNRDGYFLYETAYYDINSEIKVYHFGVYETESGTILKITV